MAVLRGTWTGNTGDVRRLQMWEQNSDSPVGLVGFDVEVFLWTRKRLYTATMIEATIEDADTGIFVVDFGPWLETAQAAVWKVAYDRVRQADSTRITWPSNWADTLPVSQHPVAA